MTPFQQSATAVAAGDFVLSAKPAVLRLPTTDQDRSFQGDMLFLGENPPMAAFVPYRLKATPDSVRVVITDASGATVREVKADTAKALQPAAGMNFAKWDLRVEPLPEPKGPPPADIGFGAPSRDGPLVLPGDYIATVFANGKAIGKTTVVVRSDPESQISSADRRANFAILTELHALNGRLTAAVAATRLADTQLGAIRKELGDTTKLALGIRATLDTLTRQVAPLKKKFLILDEGEELQYSVELFRSVLTFKLGGLFGNLSGFLTGASTQDLQALGQLRTEVPAAIGETNALGARLTAFVRQLAEAGLYPTVPKPVK